MLHDLTDAVLAMVGIIHMQEYERLLNEPTFWSYMLLTLYALYFLWFLGLFMLGIRRSQGITTGKAFLVALPGLASFQSVLLIFIR